MRLTSGYETRRARIELVPLMDVVFLLLASFVYASVTLSWAKGVKVDLPSGTGLSMPRSVLVISVMQDGSLWFENEQVELEEAVDRAAKRHLENGERVVVRGDRRSHLGIAVELLSKLRLAGVEAVTFEVTETQ